MSSTESAPQVHAPADRTSNGHAATDQPEPTVRPAPPPVPERRTTKKKKSRKKWILLFVLLIVATGIGLGIAEKRRPKPTKIQSAVIERMDTLSAIVSASGTIEARNAVDIQAEIAGNIIDLPVVEGQWVKKGDVLVKIEPTQPLADMEQMRASLAATNSDSKAQEVMIAQAEANLKRDEAFKKGAEAELVQGEVRLDLAKKKLERVRTLVTEGVSPEELLDEADSEERLANAAIAVANARIAQYEAQANATRLSIEQLRASHVASQERSRAAEASLKRAKDILSKTTIRSPIDGLLTHLNVDMGERAVPGVLSNPQATLMTIADMSVLEAWIEVDETDIIQVAMENVVEVTVDALPDDPLVAKVTEIGNAPVLQAAGAQEGKDFLVKAAIIDPPKSLRPGMSCEANITTATEADVLVMPIQAWTQREVAVDEGGNYLPEKTIWPKKSKDGETRSPLSRFKGLKEEIDGVFVIRGDRAVFRPISTGIMGEMDMQILTGLKEGEEIVIGPFKELRALIDDEWIEVDNSEAAFKKRDDSD